MRVQHLVVGALWAALLAGRVHAQPPNPSCLAPLGAHAPAIFITALERTTGLPGSRARLNFQIAAPDSITLVAVQLDGADAPNATVAGTSLANTGGVWFTTPAAGSHVVGLRVMTAFGCELVRLRTLPLVVGPPIVVPPPPPPPPPPPVVLPPAAIIRTSMDAVPNPCWLPTVTNVQSGEWSLPTTWGGAVPLARSKVQIAVGTTVTVDGILAPSLHCVGVAGTLDFSPDVPTSLKVGTLLVYDTGRVLIDTTRLAEIIIADQPLDLVNDPEQYGTGLLVWGTLTLHGAAKDPTFVRLATEPLRGQTTLTLSQAPTGWQVGDRLVLPDTRQLTYAEQNAYVPQWEELTVASVAGSTVTLTQPLTFNHRGARDGNGVLDFLPHVGNLSRNVVVRSENPSGVRGHVWATTKATVDIQYVAFQDLGRTTTAPLDSTKPGHVGTNQIGRYALHMHHLHGPAPAVAPYQYTLIGNAIDGGSARHPYKWGMGFHDAHFGLIQQNIVYNIAGGGIVTEEGNESFNLFDRNFVMRATSDYPNRGDSRGNEFAYEATCFWFRGPNNRVVNNVAANCLDGGPDSAYGFKLFGYYVGRIEVPKFPGADTMVPAQFTYVDGHTLPPLEFAGNEVYGATEAGLAYWWLGVDYRTIKSNVDSVIKDLHVWHVHNKGVFPYLGSRIVFDGLVIRGAGRTGDATTGIWMPDYLSPDFLVKHADIQGVRIGIMPTTDSGGRPQTIQDSYFRTTAAAIQFVSLYISSSGASGLPPRTTRIDRVKFDPWPGFTLKAIEMAYNAGFTGTVNLVAQDTVLVTDYQRMVGQAFQVFYREQAPGFLVPKTVTSADGTATSVGCPVAGLTNQQCRDQFGVSVAGALAPCATVRPEIVGFACPVP